MIPDEKQEYFTITTDGSIMKCVNNFSKADLYNIAYGLCYETFNEAEQNRIFALSVMERSVMNIQLMKK